MALFRALTKGGPAAAALAQAPRAAPRAWRGLRAAGLAGGDEPLDEPIIYAPRGAGEAPAERDAATVADNENTRQIAEAGTRRLVRSEEGREALRESTFDLGETTKRVLEAAAEELGDGGQAALAREAAGKAHGGRVEGGDAAERLAERVRERIIDSSQTS